MICLPCREAGDWNASGHEETAAELHAKCFGKGVCDCQHYTGKLVQVLKSERSNGSVPNEVTTNDDSDSGSKLE